MNSIALPIAWHNDDTRQAEDMGLKEMDLKDYDERNVIFYHVDALSPFFEGDQEVGCRIHVGAESFLCKLKQKDVHQRIVQSFAAVKT